jgi:hypothetical protein
MESYVPRSKGGVLKDGLKEGKPACETWANMAKNVDFPVLFSPTSNVNGFIGIECRPQKLRTFSIMSSISIGSLAFVDSGTRGTSF